MVDRLKYWLAVFAAWGGLACSNGTASLADLPCEDGSCGSGYACHPETDTCVPEISVGCDAEGFCPSTTATGERCPSVGSFLPCADGVADCSAGCRTCQADGTWSECSVSQNCAGGPEVETCDGEDNDCSGTVDDMEAHEIAADCESKLTVTASHAAVWGCNGACRVETCEAGYWDRNGNSSDGCELYCAPSAPGAEICDGEDNDCDGSVDNVADLDTDCNGQVANAQNVAEWVCSGAGTCQVGRCEAGWSDANDTGDDGCEEECIPDAPERCDGQDNDCDGLADNPGAVGCTVFFLDEDQDGVGAAEDSQCLCAAAGVYTATTAGDCNDEDANNWGSCGTCVDADEDSHYIGCDAYVTLSGPDCNDEDANNWSSCDTCVDVDMDSYYIGCDAYVTLFGPDCNDKDANSVSNCGTCADADGDSYFVGCDLYDDTVPGPDCNDEDANNWAACDTCADADEDSHYVGCDAYVTLSGPDCNDEDANNWNSCGTCADGDGDSYYAGCDAYVTVPGPDCNDGNGAVHPGATEGPQGDPTCYDSEDNDCDTLVNNQETDCWWDMSWGRRTRLTLDNAAQSEDLVDFPVLVVLDRFRVDFANIQDSGQDLRFVATDGTELSYEIEKWDEGSSTTWVFEAEYPDTEQSLDGKYNWVTGDTRVGYSRAGYKEGLPDDGEICDKDEVAICGAVLTYNFTVPAGTYYPHFRFSALEGTSNSLNWGVDGSPQEELHTDLGDWIWVTGGVSIDAPEGTSTLNVWMREDGQKLDQIVVSDSATPPATMAQDGVSYVWVRVPLVPAGSADTAIWMYFDNPTVAAGQDPSAVWDGSYAAVWHLKEDPTVEAPQFVDSTGFGNHATAQGPISADRRTDAQVGRGLNLDGSNDHLQVCVGDCSASLRITDSAFTLEAWARIGESGVDDSKSLIDKRRELYAERYYLGISQSEEVSCRATTTGGHYRLTTSAISTQAWNYIVCRYDGSLQANQFQGWVNGAQTGSTSTSGNLTDDAADELILGKRDNARYFEGRFDELRISNVARPDSYITAQHRSMRDQFVIFGVEETP